MAWTQGEIRSAPLNTLLIKLCQECGEVVQATTKWQLFGPRPLAGGVQYNNVRDVILEGLEVQMILEEIARRHRADSALARGDQPG